MARRIRSAHWEKPVSAPTSADRPACAKSRDDGPWRKHCDREERHVHPQCLVRRRLGRRDRRRPPRPPHLQRTRRAVPRQGGPRRRLDRYLLPPRCAATHGHGHRGRLAMRLPWLGLRPLRRLRPRPWPDADPGTHSRPKLSRGGAGRLPLDLDGRPSKGGPRRHRALAVSQRRGALAAPTHDVSDQGRRHADGRQPDGPDPSRLRPYLHHRRQSVAARRGQDGDRAHAARAANSPAGC